MNKNLIYTTHYIKKNGGQKKRKEDYKYHEYDVVEYDIE